MWSMPSFTPVINWRKKTNPTGLYSIHIRVTIDQISRYIPVLVPQKVRLDQWEDQHRQWVNYTHPYAFEINEEIDRKLSVLTTLNKRFYLSRKKLTFSQVFRELKPDYNPDCFNDFYDLILHEPPEAMGGSNLKRYYAAKAAFNKFNPKVSFFELDEWFFKALKKFMIEKLHLDPSTIRGYFNAYKKVMDWSRRDAHMSKEQQKEATEGVKHTGAGKKDEEFLEVHEILEWQNFVLPDELAKHQRHQDMFLLSIYTGLYYNDLKELLKAELKQDFEYGGYLRSERFKTEGKALIPLWKFPRALEIIEDYRDEDPESPYLIRRDAFIKDQPFNRILKVIIGPKGLKWDRNIYNKMARKSYSQLYIRFGTGVPQMGKMLGHEEGSAATYDYFSMNLKEIIENVKDIDFSKQGIGVKFPKDAIELRKQLGIMKDKMDTYQCLAPIDPGGGLSLMATKVARPNKVATGFLR